MKGRVLLLLLASLFSTSLELAGQRRVWNDDRTAEFKADTSIVEIRGEMYKKIISVNYSPISDEILQANFRATRQQFIERRRQIKEEQRRDSIELARLEHQMDMERSFYRLARKELRLAERELDDASDSKDKEQEEKQRRRNELIQGNIAVNPRKKN